MDKKYKMTVRIDDTFCGWEYEFPHDGRFSIHDIAEAIATHMEVTTPDGKCVREAVLFKN